MADKIAITRGSGGLLLNAVAATGRGDSIRIATMTSIRVTITGTATVDIEKMVDGTNRKVMTTVAASADYVTDEPGIYTANVTAYTNGTVTVALMT